MERMIPSRIAAAALVCALATLATPTFAAPSPAEPATAAAVASNEARAANGATLSVDLRDEYVTGFPILVTVTVRNDTTAPLTFPDLAARPHLVRFNMKKGTVKWERFTTPPAADPPTVWTLSPRTQRQVTLEIPSSGGLDPGQWELGVSVTDPAGAVTFDRREVRLAPARPAGGVFSYEPTIQQNYGAMIPWVHQAAGGFDLYLMQMAPKSANKVLGQFFLARLPSAADPVLTRVRASDAAARYIYWASAQGITLARLEGTTLRGKPRTFSLPYPKVELLGRGVTDAKGGAVLPLWVPDPNGSSGTVRALCIEDRGNQVLREVTRLPARPTSVATGVDAASNLLLAMGHAAGVDLYRVDPTLAPEIGARGARVAALTEGWGAAALAFDTLPDQGDRPGGLALLSVLTRGAGAEASYRTIWADLSGRTLRESSPLPWAAPGPITAFLPAGLGPFYYLSTDSAGALWYGVQAGAPTKVDGGWPGTLWASPETVAMRRLVPGTVIEDRVLGPTVR